MLDVILGSGNRLHLSLKCPYLLQLPSTVMGTVGFFPGINQPGHVADHLPHVVPGLGVNGALPPLPPCAFLSCTGRC